MTDRGLSEPSRADQGRAEFSKRSRPPQGCARLSSASQAFTGQRNIEQGLAVVENAWLNTTGHGGAWQSLPWLSRPEEGVAGHGWARHSSA
eukprot:1003524-Pyramimonas_sp.AAC.1